MLQIRELIDVVSIEKISVIGFLLLTAFVLGWFAYKLQNSIAELRQVHAKEMSDLNEAHKKEIKELIDEHDKKYNILMEKLMAQMEKHVEVYKQAQSANNQFVQSIKDLKNV